MAFRSEDKADELRRAEYYNPNKVEIITGIDAEAAESLIPVFDLFSLFMN